MKKQQKLMKHQRGRDVDVRYASFVGKYTSVISQKVHLITFLLLALDRKCFEKLNHKNIKMNQVFMC